MSRQKPAVVMATILAALTMAATAQAVPILQISSQGAGNAEAAEQAYLNSLDDYVTETFEGFAVGAGLQSPAISTAVGTFSRDLAGFGGQCDNNGYSCAGGLAVLDAAASPYSGRFPAPEEVGNNQWLDSMDAREMTFSPLGGTTAVGFYMTDPNDAGGRFSVGGVDFLFTDIFGSSLGNGRVYYLTLLDTAGLGDLTIYSNNPDDGYGIDSVTIARKVPEPSTVLLVALGMLGLVALRRRQT